jgi:predicted RNA-binding Zn ribbon-like protein
MTVDQPARTGQWFGSGGGTRWWFEPGALCLDFAYTGALGENPAWERLYSPGDLASWLQTRFDQVDAAGTERELVDALALRAAIARVAVAVAGRMAAAADDIDTINLYAATPNIPPSLPGGNRHAGRSSVRIGQALSTLARDAVALFAAGQAGRIRQCAADDCGLIFFDESRSNNRRWCSMLRCGNRSKVRAHRARISAGSTPEGGATTEGRQTPGS